MDSIERLPRSSGFTSILVVIDRLSKEAVFITTSDNATAIDVASPTYLRNTASPSTYPPIAARSLHPTSFALLAPSFACDYTSHLVHHPSANRQVERVKSTLEQHLRIYCNYQQDNWSKLLPLAEFAYNNAPHSSTGVSLFFTTKGYDPLIAVHPDAEITDLRARHFAIDFDEIHRFLRDRMKDAQDSMTQSANSRVITAPTLPCRRSSLPAYRPHSYQPNRSKAVE